MVAHMRVSQSDTMLGASWHRTIRVPETWHLSELVRPRCPSTFAACGANVTDGTVKSLSHWRARRFECCDECEAKVGAAARNR
jgi:hypothetical protein